MTEKFIAVVGLGYDCEILADVQKWNRTTHAEQAFFTQAGTLFDTRAEAWAEVKRRLEGLRAEQDGYFADAIASVEKRMTP